MQIFCTKPHYLQNSRGSETLKICATKSRLSPNRIYFIPFPKSVSKKTDWKLVLSKYSTDLLKDFGQLTLGLGNLNQDHFLKT